MIEDGAAADPRILLRRWRESDLAAYFDIYSRWEVMRWLGAPPRRVLTDHDEARRGLARWHEVEAGLAPPYGLWALVEVDGADEPVGTVLLLPLRDADRPTPEVEIGWHLHPDRQGRGLVTEAAQALFAGTPTRRRSPDRRSSRRAQVPRGMPGRFAGP